MALARESSIPARFAQSGVESLGCRHSVAWAVGGECLSKAILDSRFAEPRDFGRRRRLVVHEAVKDSKFKIGFLLGNDADDGCGDLLNC